MVKQWTRYGHDRLYVQTPDGTRLGYWDNKTDRSVVEDEAHRGAVEAAVAEHRGLPAGPLDAVGVPMQTPPPEARAQAIPDPVGPALVAPATPRPPVPVMPIADAMLSTGVDASAKPAWVDLSTNRPGQAAREQAAAHRQAAPVKTLFARVLGVHIDERAWRIGADGEEAVATRLAKLGPEWKVLHAVPVGDRGSDIDHVVIGPAGVFTINAKHHTKASVWVGGNTFMVNGQPQPYVRNSRHEAQRAGRLLTTACNFPVAVTGLIAVMGAHEGFTVREQPPGGDVVVLTRREVDRWLRKRPVGALCAEEVEAVHEAARRSNTWVGHA